MTKADVVAAAEALLAAAKGLPEDTKAVTRDHVLAALKRYDAAENLLDDAIDEYMAATRKGAKQ